MRTEIVSVGTELLLGEITDTNATYMAQQLKDIGLDLMYMTTVGDNESRIAEVIEGALDRADIVLVGGGLGPTVDDVTREGIAQATGRRLVLNEVLLEQIAERFRRFGSTMGENNKKQAYVPDGALPIENIVGTAPIFILVTDRGVIIVTPGVPREMKYLMEHEIIPWLKNYTDAPAVIKSLILRTAGIGESQIDAQIEDLMKLHNPTVGLAAHTGQVDIRVTAKAETDAEAIDMIRQVDTEIRERIGRWIYGTGDLAIEAAVIELLVEQNKTIATLELNTQDALHEKLIRAAHDQPELVRSAVVLNSLDELKDYVNNTDFSTESLAKAAAIEVRTLNQADFGVAIVVVDTIDEHGEYVVEAAIGLASAKKSRSRLYTWVHRRTDSVVWFTTHAFAMLRSILLDNN